MVLFCFHSPCCTVFFFWFSIVPIHRLYAHARFSKRESKTKINFASKNRDRHERCAYVCARRRISGLSNVSPENVKLDERRAVDVENHHTDYLFRPDPRTGRADSRDTSGNQRVDPSHVYLYSNAVCRLAGNQSPRASGRRLSREKRNADGVKCTFSARRHTAVQVNRSSERRSKRHPEKTAGLYYRRRLLVKGILVKITRPAVQNATVSIYPANFESGFRSYEIRIKIFRFGPVRMFGSKSRANATTLVNHRRSNMRNMRQRRL